MFIPDRFTSSTLTRQMQYDEEGRMREKRPLGAPHDDGGIADSNSLYATDAERFGSIAPFLKKNKIKDARRRNYIIQAGGACIYFKEDPQAADPYGGGKVQFTAPSDRESFGHNSLDGTKLGEPSGQRFTLGANT